MRIVLGAAGILAVAFVVGKVGWEQLLEPVVQGITAPLRGETPRPAYCPPKKKLKEGEMPIYEPRPECQ